MHPRIRELTDYIEVERARLRATVDAIDPSRLDRAPSGGGWSVIGVLEHLSIVEGKIAGLIRKLATEARAADAAKETETSAILPAIDVARFLDRTRKLDAPRSSQPTSTTTVTQAWQTLDATRADLRDAIDAADGLALGAIAFPHIYFGPLNVYEWIALVGAHEARHADQVREIAATLAAAG